MKVEYTAFGQTKLVEVALNNMKDGETPDVISFMCRPEEYYGIDMKKKTAVVTPDHWSRGTVLKDTRAPTVW